MPNSQELEEIKKYCKNEGAIFLKIEPFASSVNDFAQGKPKINIPDTKTGKSILPQHTIYVDLTISEEKLLSQMHEKTRYNIRLAQKKGVIVKEENSPEALEEFIKILVDTERRQGFYSHYPDYYRNLWKNLHPEKMVFLLNAYVQADSPVAAGVNGQSLQGKQLAASIMLFRFKDFLYYPYGGSDYDMRQFMAPQLLHFEAMKLGKRLGCKTYDLWGSYKNSPNESDPWWGFYRLKSGLGGREINFPPTVDVPLSPLYGPLMIADDLRWKLLLIKKKFK